MSEFTEKAPAPLPPDLVLADPVPPRRSFWKEQRLPMLVAAIVAALVSALIAALVTIALVSALSTYQRPGTGATGGRGTLVQQGTVVVTPGNPAEVYYPVPYAVPPNLVLEGPNAMSCIMLEQKQDHFKVRTIWVSDHPGINVRWKAEGVAAPDPINFGAQKK